MTITSTAPQSLAPAAPAAQPLAPVPLAPATAVGFSPEQIAALAAPLDRAHVHSHSQAGRSLSYVEGWQVIAEANRIFGFDGWQRETLQLRCVSQAERLIGSRSSGREPKPGWGVTYTARVRVTVVVAGQPALIREGSGAGHGIDADLGLAHESALKEAETDAMKRALMTFGNPFGLALYDKQQRQVSRPGQGAEGHRGPAQPQAESTTPRPAAPAPSQRPAAATPPQALLPLDPPTIARIHATLRALPQHQLAVFTAAFRRRFQIPADAGTIADRIVQKQHHDWIEAWLVQQQTGHGA